MVGESDGGPVEGEPVVRTIATRGQDSFAEAPEHIHYTRQSAPFLMHSPLTVNNFGATHQSLFFGATHQPLDSLLRSDNTPPQWRKRNHVQTNRNEQFVANDICIVHAIPTLCPTSLLGGIDEKSGTDYSFRREWIAGEWRHLHLSSESMY